MPGGHLLDIREKTKETKETERPLRELCCSSEGTKTSERNGVRVQDKTNGTGKIRFHIVSAKVN